MMRTPLGLVPEADGSFSIFFTAFDGTYWEGWGCLGRVRVAVDLA
jgi:hypothetical protein